MTRAQQLPFDLGHREAFAREDLWVSAANADAVAWLDKYPDWGAPALVIYGPPASGKTHLCHVWQKKSGAVTVEKSDIARLAAANDFPTATIIDDAEGVAGDAGLETALFHFYNRAKEEGAHVLLTGTHAPKEWKLSVPDLRSRLLAAPAAAVGAPDEQLMAVVLAKLFSDRQLVVSQDVIAFILPRLERSFEALRAIAADVDRKALAEKRAVTIPLVREILQEQGKLF
jgi:DnaA regulatory inactivator Hda